MKFSSVTAAVLAALLCSSAALAQQSEAPQSDSTIKATSEEVLLDVVVRDKKGRPVTDLKPGDLEVIDGGTKRDIKSLRFVQGGESVDAANGARKPLDPLRQVRLITLIFHGLDQNGQVLARKAALDLIKSELDQNVYMSVLAIDHTLEALQAFTNDRALLKTAIERATSGAHDYASDSEATLHQLEQAAGPMQGGGTSLSDRVASISNGGSGGAGPSGAPNGSSAATAAMAQMMLGMLRASKEDATTDFGRSTIYALLDAVKEQYRLPGRKTILLFSPGFPKPQSAEEQFNTVISMANRSNVSFYAIDTRGLATVSSTNSAIDALAGGAADSRANASTGGGVTRDMALAADRVMDAGRQDTELNLGVLAKGTGGELFSNSNDFRNPLKRVVEDVESYYELAYSPDIEKYDGTFRKVVVRAADSHLRIQAPAGYFAIPPSLTANGQALSPFEVPLLRALTDKPLPRDISFHAAGLHYETADGSPMCELVLDVPISQIAVTKSEAEAKFTGRFAYVALIKDLQGNLLKKFRSEIPLSIAEDKLQAYKEGHFVYSEPVRLPAGRYTLETAVIDYGTNKIGARKASFIVPTQPSGQLSISSVATVRSMKPTAGTTNPGDDPFLYGQQSVTPSLDPTIKKSVSGSLPFYVVLYTDKNSHVPASLEIEFDKDGQRLAKMPVELSKPDATGKIQYVVTAPVEKLQPGGYQVRFLAKQGNEAAIETTSFGIEP